MTKKKELTSTPFLVEDISININGNIFHGVVLVTMDGTGCYQRIGDLRNVKS